jgi:hypothetical protein
MMLTIILALVSTSLALPITCDTNDQECKQVYAARMFNQANEGCNIEQKGVGISKNDCLYDGGHLVDDVLYGTRCVGFNGLEQQTQCLAAVSDRFAKTEEEISNMSHPPMGLSLPVAPADPITCETKECFQEKALAVFPKGQKHPECQEKGEVAACLQEKAIALFKKARNGCDIQEEGIDIPQAQCENEGGQWVADPVYSFRCVGFNLDQQQSWCLANVSKWFANVEDVISQLSVSESSQ